MKLKLILLIAVFLHLTTKGSAQNIRFSGKNVSLQSVITAVEKQTGYLFMYMAPVLNSAKPVTIQAENIPLEKFLADVFKSQPLQYDIRGKNIYISLKPAAGSNGRRSDQLEGMGGTPVRIKVLDSTGNALYGASIVIKNSKVSGVTDAGGVFNVNVNAGDVLLISYVGYETRLVNITPAMLSSSNNLVISLMPSVTNLDNVEVFSTGYQTLLRERTTGSVEVISNKKFNEQVGTNVLSRLPAIANGFSYIPARLTGSQNVMLLRGSQTIFGPKGPLIVLDNFPYEGDLENINPNDVENITLLKDAAAASIWGAKAGNGVIVITTKKGRLNQKVIAEASTSLTIVNKPDLFYERKANSSEFIEFETFLFSNGYYDAELENQPFLYHSPVIDILQMAKKKLITETEAAERIDALRNKDLRNDLDKYVYQKAIRQQYALNLRGGSNNVAWVFFAGLDRNKENLDESYDRGNVRFSNTYKPIKKLTITAGVNFTYSKRASGKTTFGDIAFPYTQLVDEQGNELPLYPQFAPSFLDTAGKGKLLDWKYYPLQDYKHNTTNTVTKNVLSNLGINYFILPGLDIDLSYRLELQQQEGRTLYDEESYYTRDYINAFTTINYATNEVTRPVPLGGILSMKDNNITSHDIRGQINWKKIWERHEIIAVAGADLKMTTIQNNANRLYGYSKNIMKGTIVDYLKSFPRFISNFGSGFIMNELRISEDKKNVIGQYISMSYTFDRKYSISASARKDAANLFGVNINDKWKPFWSVGGAWNISNEKFYNSSWLPNVKIRTSYGYSGNMLPNATAVTTIFYGSVSEYTRGQIAFVNSFFNPDLKWEKIGTVNIGIDLQWKNERVAASIDFYNKKGSDLYDWTKIDATLGLERDLITLNNSTIQGRGIEADLRSVNLTGQVRWISDLKFNYYNEKVLKALESGPYASNYVGEGSGFAPGKPRYGLFAYKWAGLDPATGDPLGYFNGKISKDYVAITDSATFNDLIYKGSVLPTFYGSLGNTFSYKNISLTARITYAFGYYFLRQSFEYSNSLNSLSIHEDFANRWKKPGDEKQTNVPSLRYDEDYYRGYFYWRSEQLATRGDHIRLQYINLSYALTKNIIKKLPFSELRISAIANDLGILWRANKLGIDPASTSSVPTPKSFVISVNANF